MILEYVIEIVACRVSIDTKTNFQFQLLISLKWSTEPRLREPLNLTIVFIVQK